MKIFTEKSFENRLAQERERVERERERERERYDRDRYIMERLDNLNKDLNELGWRVNRMEAKVEPSKTPVCEEVLKCEGR